MESLLHDLKFGLKLLWKEKGFSITALLTLAICIAANASIFSVINSVLFNPLPFHESDRVVMVFNSYPAANIPRASAAVPDFFDAREKIAAFGEVAIYQDLRGYTLGESGSPTREMGREVSPSFFHLLKVEPLLGRLFTEEEMNVGSNQTVILSYGYWQEMYGGQEARLPLTAPHTEKVERHDESARVPGIEPSLPQGHGDRRGHLELVQEFPFRAGEGQLSDQVHLVLWDGQDLDRDPLHEHDGIEQVPPTGHPAEHYPHGVKHPRAGVFRARCPHDVRPGQGKERGGLCVSREGIIRAGLLHEGSVDSHIHYCSRTDADLVHVTPIPHLDQARAAVPARRSEHGPKLEHR